MKNDNWISRIQQTEFTPPPGSWDKIQSKRKLKTRQQWSAAIAAGAIAIGGFIWLGTSTQNSEYVFTAKQPTASNTLLNPKVEVEKSVETKPNSAISVQPIQKSVTENIDSNTEKSQVSTQKNMSGFPYNGKVNTTAESIPIIAHPHFENSSEIVSSDINAYNSIIPEKLENTIEELKTSYDIDWSNVPNLFTPNQDGQNDMYSPFEGMPEWIGKGWMIRSEGNFAQSFLASEKWDGNNNLGFEMPEGQYIVEALYVDSPQSTQVQKRVMLLKLVR